MELPWNCTAAENGHRFSTLRWNMVEMAGFITYLSWLCWIVGSIHFKGSYMAVCQNLVPLFCSHQNSWDLWMWITHSKSIYRYWSIAILVVFNITLTISYVFISGWLDRVKPPFSEMVSLPSYPVHIPIKQMLYRSKNLQLSHFFLDLRPPSAQSWALSFDKRSSRVDCANHMGFKETSFKRFFKDHLTCSRYMAMDQYLYIPFLGGWTSIYQLFWCSPGG